MAVLGAELERVGGTVKRSTSALECIAVPLAAILGALSAIGGGLLFCCAGGGTGVGACLEALTTGLSLSAVTGDVGTESVGDNSSFLKLRFLRIGVAMEVEVCVRPLLNFGASKAI